MSLSERIFDAVTQFPSWLESFDSLNIPGWAVLFAMSFATVGLIFAAREFLSWFLKTNSIIDEVIRLEAMVRDLQGDLSALEKTVERLQSTVHPDATPVHEAAEPTFAAPEKPVKKPTFRLDL